jgi:glucokinase
VSFERLLSGAGIELIFRALADRAGLPQRDLDAPEITRLALDGGDALCRETIDVFCAILGTAAANLAVSQVRSVVSTSAAVSCPVGSLL